MSDALREVTVNGVRYFHADDVERWHRNVTATAEHCDALEEDLEQAIASRNRLLRFVDAVSPFVRDVLDEPFPWQHGGQRVVWMTRDEYDEASAALAVLCD